MLNVVGHVIAEFLFSVFIVVESIVALSTVSESIVTLFYVAKSIVVKSIERVHCSVVFSYRAIGAESLVARPIVAGSIERCPLL